jgi:hypothetical protein
MRYLHIVAEAGESVCVSAHGEVGFKLLNLACNTRLDTSRGRHSRKPVVFDDLFGCHRYSDGGHYRYLLVRLHFRSGIYRATSLSAGNPPENTFEPSKQEA